MAQSDAMHRFYAKLVPVALLSIWSGYSLFLTALGAVAFLLLFFPISREWGERMMNWQDISPWWAVVPIGLLCLWGMLKANYVAYRELEEQLESMKLRFDATNVLEGIKAEIDKLSPALNKPASITAARGQLEDIQKRVVHTLYQDGSKWNHVPEGWLNVASSNVPKLYVWAALAAVFEQRYSAEIPSLATLYNKLTNSGAQITQDNFPAEKAHATKLVGLIVREIKHPETANPIEHKDVFLQTVQRYVSQNTTKAEKPSGH